MKSDIYNLPPYSGTHGNAKVAVANVTSATGEVDQIVKLEAGTIVLSVAVTGAGTVGYSTESGDDATAFDGAFAPYTFAEDGEVIFTPSADGETAIVVNYV